MYKVIQPFDQNSTSHTVGSNKSRRTHEKSIHMTYDKISKYTKYTDEGTHVWW